MHKDIYTIGHRLSKRDKLGLHAQTERLTLELFAKVIEAAFNPIHLKQKVLEVARISVELLKNIIRTERELEIIDQRTYLRLAEQTVEISKMLNGWIGYITQKKSS